MLEEESLEMIEAQKVEEEIKESENLCTAINTIHDLLPPRVQEETKYMESEAKKAAEKEGVNTLRFCLKTIGQIYLQCMLNNKNSDIDPNDAWKRWSEEGYSAIYGEFYDSEYLQILGSPVTIAELFIKFLKEKYNRVIVIDITPKLEIE